MKPAIERLGKPKAGQAGRHGYGELDVKAHDGGTIGDQPAHGNDAVYITRLALI